MFFNILLMTEPASPASSWVLLFFALIFGIPFFIIMIFKLILIDSPKGGFVVAGIAGLGLVALWLFGLFEVIEEQKTYDEWYKNYHEEIVYDEIYSFDLNSPTFVIGCSHYLESDSIKYLFYIKKEDESETYQLAYIPEGYPVYVKEVESDFNVIAVNKENSTTVEYYINVPKGSFTKPVASSVEDNLVHQ